MKNNFKMYRRKITYLEVRPYEEGEDMTEVLTSVSDRESDSLKGGVIVRSPLSPDVQWYLGKEFFNRTYEEVTQDEYISKMPRPWRYQQNIT